MLRNFPFGKFYLVSRYKFSPLSIISPQIPTEGLLCASLQGYKWLIPYLQEFTFYEEDRQHINQQIESLHYWRYRGDEYSNKLKMTRHEREEAHLFSLQFLASSLILNLIFCFLLIFLLKFFTCAFFLHPFYLSLW